MVLQIYKSSSFMENKKLPTFSQAQENLTKFREDASHRPKPTGKTKLQRNPTCAHREAHPNAHGNKHLNQI
jgi:hypothetical protein